MGENIRSRQTSRDLAQATIHSHINRRRGANSTIDWNFIHVIWVKGLGESSWVALVRVENLPGELFQVSYDKVDDRIKVDTFTRKHVSRYY